MTGPRHDKNEIDVERPHWPAAAAPHGYDPPEFSPEQSPRDFPHRAKPAGRKPREPDEEQRYLRSADAAMGSSDGRADTAFWAQDSEEDEEDAETRESAPSRLYRD